MTRPIQAVVGSYATRATPRSFNERAELLDVFCQHNLEPVLQNCRALHRPNFSSCKCCCVGVMSLELRSQLKKGTQYTATVHGHHLAAQPCSSNSQMRRSRLPGILASGGSQKVSTCACSGEPAVWTAALACSRWRGAAPGAGPEAGQARAGGRAGRGRGAEPRAGEGPPPEKRFELAV